MPFCCQQVDYIRGNGLLALSCFDIISIWTSEANQADEMNQGKLRCLKTFHNQERKCRNMDAEKWWNGGLSVDQCRFSSNPLSSTQMHNCSKMLPDPEVPRKETAFTVAAVVYNSLWSHLICDTSRLFPLRLLGIWIMKEQCLKSAFSFPTSSISCLSEKRAFVFQLQTSRSLQPEESWSVSNWRI